jgi:uncharacterized protein YqhQ
MSELTARPYIGGQAVIEGVMMRSPRSVAIVCRRRSGELVVREQPMAAPVSKGPRRWPFVRGVVTLVESLRLGSHALRWSAELFEQDFAAAEAAAGTPGSNASGAGQASGAHRISSALALSIVALVTQEPEPAGGSGPAPEAGKGASPDEKKWGLLGMLPILFAIVLFVALPQAGAEGINRLFHLGLEVTSPAYQAITGAAKLAIVVGYLLGIRQIDDIRRVFQYHGAEHKSISTYEAGEALEVENARRKTTMHPRCGTTFLVMVALVSVVVFSIAGAFLPKLSETRWVESISFFLMKLPFLPFIAAVTFEIQRLFARYCTVGPLRALLWPGFLVQKITTAEPEDAQLEVALASLRATLWREDAVAAPAPPDRVFEDYAKLLADPGYAGAHG